VNAQKEMMINTGSTAMADGTERKGNTIAPDPNKFWGGLGWQ